MLTEEQKESLYDCLESTQEGDLSPKERVWLNGILGKSKQAQEIFLEYMRLSANMQWSYGTVPGDVDYPQDKLILGTPPHPELLKPPTVKRRKNKQPNSSPQSHAALWVVLPVLLAGFLWGGIFLLFSTRQEVPGHFVAHLVGAVEARWKHGENHWLIGQGIRGGEELHLEQGLVELESTSGVRMMIEGPSLFVPMQSGVVKLHFGSLFANVPKQAVGFVVETPASRIVDLGTKFGVVVSQTGETEVHVIQGRVEAGLFDNSGHVVNSRRLAANDAVRIQKRAQSITDIKVRPEKFAQGSIVRASDSSNVFTTSLHKEYGITQHSASIVFQEEMPASLVSEDYQPFEHDDQVFLFPEREKVLLTENLPVEISKPGVYRSVEDFSGENNFIPAGTTVDCFLFHNDPIDIPEEPEDFIQGEVHFDRPILGLILSTDQLKKTDVWFNPRIQGNPGQKFDHRGFEFGSVQKKGVAVQEEITISEDRKSLFFSSATTVDGFDEFRVFTKSQGEFPE